MAINKSRPMHFTPKGLVDAYDSTGKFPGACQQLANLIFDPSNPEYVIARPGCVSITQLASMGFLNPTFISIQEVIGNLCIGMVATSRFPGHDEPFVVDLFAGTNVPLTGVTSGNTPLSQPTSGDWIPPTMANIGVQVPITHPGFSGTGSNFVGLINLTTFVWSSFNLATHPMAAVPIAVANFNNRAYYAVASSPTTPVRLLAFSDVLDATTRTNASQELTVGDMSSMTGLSGLPIQTTSSGVTSGLLAFKGTQLWQVTGDALTSNLALNFLSLEIGTYAPRTIAQSALGTYFLTTGGPYLCDLLGALHPLSHEPNNPLPDIQTAFINAQTPSRWAAAYNSSIYRVCGPTVINGQPQTNDYWFDERRRRWTGPHSFVYDCASAYKGDFILTGALYSSSIIRSQSSPQLSSAYQDLGVNYNCTMLSSTFPKTGDMLMKQVAESQIELGGQPLGASYTITAYDEGGNILNSVPINVPSLGLPVWGSGLVWGGGALWSSSQSRPAQTYAVPWTEPLVFEKMSIGVTAVASANVFMGVFGARYQETGYMTQKSGA